MLIPSLSIIYPPYSKSRKMNFSMLLFPFQLDKIKVGGDSCLPQNFSNTNAKCKPAFSLNSPVLPPYHTFHNDKTTIHWSNKFQQRTTFHNDKATIHWKNNLHQQTISHNDETTIHWRKTSSYVNRLTGKDKFLK